MTTHEAHQNDIGLGEPSPSKGLAGQPPVPPFQFGVSRSNRDLDEETNVEEPGGSPGSDDLRRYVEAVAAQASEISNEDSVIDKANPAGSDSAQSEAPRPTSEKQKAANRRNSQRSTGPKSAEGKARTAANRLTHGLYATTNVAISRGRFAEDNGVIEAFLEQIVGSLPPRDVVEFHAAQQIAQAMLRAVRLDRFELAAIDGESTVSAAELNRLGNPDLAELFLDVVDVIEEICPLYLPQDGSSRSEGHRDPFADYGTAGEGPYAGSEADLEADSRLKAIAADLDWEVLGRYIVDHAFPTMTFKYPWPEDRPPEDDDEWRRVFRSLVRSKFLNLDEARTWLRSQRARHYAQYLRSAGLPESLAAHRILGGSLEKSLLHRSRIDRSLDQALARYDKLQERALPQE